ncbi:MAG: methionine--tRNA ligase [Candidatus Woesearchaeota archaeon]
MIKKHNLITAALPYANGPIHLGHMLEYIQTDIYSRFLKLTGNDAVFVCADDTHGTPIEINASKLGKKPEEVIERYYKEHLEDFNGFLIAFDNYSWTNSTANKEMSDFFFNKLKEGGFIYEKEVEQAFCENCRRFLPDRYVKGKCPRCSAEDQYGDQCEKCNAAYKTVELVEPYCAICKDKPTRKKSTHYFFKLSSFSQQLKDWLTYKQSLQSEVKNFVMNWVDTGLEDWDITRDAPYFGFPVAGESSKYYYVWFDAPICYIATTKEYCAKAGKKLEDYWQGKDSSVIHFIGKDITYHHFLFWPAMLLGAGFNLPEDIVVHGHITLSGEKMSKSKGTFITAKQYLHKQDPEFLRFYYAANLSHSMTDLNLDEDDFSRKINNDLVANIANFAYRTLSFANNNFDSKLSNFREDSKFIDEFSAKIALVKDAYETYNFREAVRLILEISALGNKYFQENEPWQLIKKDKKRCHEVVTFAANIVKNISILISPILPKFATRLQKQLGLNSLAFKDIGFDLKNCEIEKARIIFAKIEGKALPFEGKKFPLSLKVAEIVSVENHPGADKLYLIKVRIGKEERQLVAGLKSYYEPKELVGKKVVVVTNLAAATIRGVESKGMILAADNGADIKLLEAAGSESGDSVSAGSPSSEAEITIDEFKKVKLAVKANRILWGESILKTPKEEVSVDISDGAIVR